MRRSVLITGVAGGIGAAAAALFIKNGWDVFGIDRSDFRLKGVNFFACDLSEPGSIRTAFKEVGAAAKTLDALVNNAAVSLCKPLGDTEVEEWDTVLDVNLRSFYLAVKYARPFLRSPGGAVVNVSSVHARATSSDISAYAASKGGVSALTRAMAVELSKDGIRANAVLPGAVDTQMLREGLRRGSLGGATVEERLAALGGKTPLGRVGRPEEIAEAILFLADNERSSFATGSALVVDGGALARLSTE